MNGSHATGSESARSRLRATIASIERELLLLDHPPTDLLSSFVDLVDQLDLGPEPEVRQCPVCQHTCRRTATLCDHCWTTLTPPASGEGLST